MAALRLSPSPPAGVVLRIVGGALFACLGLGGVLVSIHWLGLVPLLLANPPDSVGNTLNWLWGWLWAFLYCVGGVTLPAGMALQTIRARSTLDGTVLTVRGMFRSRSADLAVARLRGETTDNVNERGVAEVALVALMPGSDQEVRLVLGDSGGILPRPQLAALADAVAAGDLDDDGRRELVERLRLFVRQPFAVPRYLWADPPPLRRS